MDSSDSFSSREFISEVFDWIATLFLLVYSVSSSSFVLVGWKKLTKLLSRCLDVLNFGFSFSLSKICKELDSGFWQVSKSQDQSFMEGNSTTLPQDHNKEEEEVVEEEYVLFDLDAVMGQVHIPSNAPYVLSGLDTLNPILTIDEKIKLVGEYEETVGTCLVFSESDAAPVIHEETGPSEANLFSGACIVDSKQAPARQVMPITRLHKILKFRLMEDAESIGSKDEQTNNANEKFE